MVQNGPGWGLNGHLGAILGGIFGYFLDLGRNFCKTGRSAKLAELGVSWSLLGAVLRDLGHKSGYVGQSWGYVGTFLAACWSKDAEDEPR